jgi:hypothetical protein
VIARGFETPPSVGLCTRGGTRAVALRKSGWRRPGETASCHGGQVGEVHQAASGGTSGSGARPDRLARSGVQLADRVVQATLVTSSGVAMKDALTDHRVDDGHGCAKVLGGTTRVAVSHGLSNALHHRAHARAKCHVVAAALHRLVGALRCLLRVSQVAGSPGSCRGMAQPPHVAVRGRAGADLRGAGNCRPTVNSCQTVRRVSCFFASHPASGPAECPWQPAC